MPTFKNSKKKNGRRISWSDFSPCNSTNREGAKLITKTSLVTKLDEDNESSLGKTSTVTYPNSEMTSGSGWRRDSCGSSAAWSVNSMLAIVPASPSPVCSPLLSFKSSSSSHSSDLFYSQFSSPFSTPRKKSSRVFSIGKASKSSNEIEEERQDFFDMNMMRNSFKEGEEGFNNKDCSSKRSSAHGSGASNMDHTFLNLPWMVVSEEKSHEKRLSDYIKQEDSEIESPMLHEHHRLMARPKPYPAFLEQLKKQELEAKVNEWKETKQLKLMNKLRRKEDVIRTWELKRTGEAVTKMERAQKKLERERAHAFQKMQNKITMVERKASEKRAKEKRSTIKKMSTISRAADKIKSTKKLIWLKLLRCISL